MVVKYELPFTQTSHVAAFICTLLVAVALSPVGNFDLRDAQLLVSLLRLVHLAAFSTWLGVQVWVTFIAGVTMFRHLPRHTFGFIQGKLFPKYFLLGTILSCASILSYLVEHPFTSWGYREKMQGYSLAVSLVMVLANLVYFEPQTSRCVAAKHVLEKEQQAGNTIGKIDDDKMEILKKNEKYVALDKRFFLLHSLSSIANLVALSAQAIHLWHIAGHLSTI